jgi:hypothetical protein
MQIEGSSAFENTGCIDSFDGWNDFDGALGEMGLINCILNV